MSQPKAPNRASRRAAQRARRKLKPGMPRSPFHQVPAAELADTARTVDPPHGFRRMFRNEALIVFECDRPGGLILLMVQRIDAKDGLSWDLLQWVKGALGYGDREALELYPPDDRLINSANMRHLWMLPAGQCFPFGLDHERRTGGLALDAPPPIPNPVIPTEEIARRAFLEGVGHARDEERGATDLEDDEAFDRWFNFKDGATAAPWACGMGADLRAAFQELHDQFEADPFPLGEE